MDSNIPDEAFWNRRYKSCPQGSGVGSRGEFAKVKLAHVQKCMKEEEIESIVDLGCGDLYWIKHLDTLKYTGVDFSQTVIAKNRQIKPKWVFKCIDFSEEEIDEKADLTICLDVLIHQPTFRQHNIVIENALKSSEKILLIAGYRFKPKRVPQTMYFYETIFEALERRGIDYQNIYSYRESAILKVKRQSSELET